MSSSSPTVATLAVQLARVAQSQDDLRSLLLDSLREMLKVATMQAESTATFARLLEQQQQLLQAWTQLGPGTSRDRTEAQEYREWRAAIEERSAT